MLCSTALSCLYCRLRMPPHCHTDFSLTRACASGRSHRIEVYAQTGFVEAAADGVGRLPPRSAGAALQRIQQRFESGRPSDSLAEAGVMAHVFDGYEDSRQPWMVCHGECIYALDSLAASVLTWTLPWLYEGSHVISGFLLVPDIEVVCVFPSESVCHPPYPVGPICGSICVCARFARPARRPHQCPFWYSRMTYPRATTALCCPGCRASQYGHWRPCARRVRRR